MLTFALAPSLSARSIASLVLAGAALCVSLWTAVAARARAGRLARVLQDPEIAAALRRTDADLPGLRQRLDQVDGAVRQLATEFTRSLTSPGVVHFRAYDTAGPALSFSLALLDRSGDGLVLTSLFGRAETRVYTKRIAAGAPVVKFSPEESEALRLARAGGGSVLWDGR